MKIPHRPFTWFSALLPIIFLCILLSTNLIIFGHKNAMLGPNQMALFLSSFLGILVCLYHGISWSIIEQGIVQSVSDAIPALLVLLLIGVLGGCWLISGIIPAMIYYGIQILHPSFFYFLSCLFCCLVSLAIGSSWSTVATIGLVLVGIGKTLGLHDGIVAGAVISGAYFGNKISPLSDTVLLTSHITKVTQYKHIRFSLKTNIPSIAIALLLYLVIGFYFAPPAISKTDISIIQMVLKQKFNLSPFLFLIPITVIYLSLKRIPAFIVLFTGAILGCITALLFQPKILCAVANTHTFSFFTFYKSILQTLYGEIRIITNHELLNSLLVGHGMIGMLSTIWLVIAAMVFGGIMHISGMLNFIIQSIIKLLHARQCLVSTTIFSCIFLNLTTSEQYLAILLPGNLYKPYFEKKKIPLVHLSRALGDSATVTSPLIPWNACGAIQSNILNVNTLMYLPYCFFNLLNPFVNLFFTFLAVYRTKNK